MPALGRTADLTSEGLDARDPLASLRDRFNIQSDMTYRDGTLLIFWGSRANAIYRRSGRGGSSWLEPTHPINQSPASGRAGHCSRPNPSASEV